MLLNMNRMMKNKIMPTVKWALYPVIFQVASLLAALAHPGHIVCYAPGDSLLCRRDAS